MSARGADSASPRASRIPRIACSRSGAGGFRTSRLITQNVDGLHESLRQGYGARNSRRVIRLHGSIWEVSCWQAARKSPKRWRDETLSFDEAAAAMPVLRRSDPPRRGLVSARRSIQPWFGRASQAAECDVFITIGTSAIVYPAAGFIAAARQHGAFTVEINPRRRRRQAPSILALTAGASCRISPRD